MRCFELTGDTDEGELPLCGNSGLVKFSGFPNSLKPRVLVLKEKIIIDSLQSSQKRNFLKPLLLDKIKNANYVSPNNNINIRAKITQHKYKNKQTRAKEHVYDGNCGVICVCFCLMLSLHYNNIHTTNE